MQKFIAAPFWAIILAASPVSAQMAPVAKAFAPILEARLGADRLILRPHGYVQPVLIRNLIAAYGDSRTANTGGITWGSPAVTSSASFGAGYAGFLGPLSGNKFLINTGWT